MARTKVCCLVNNIGLVSSEGESGELHMGPGQRKALRLEGKETLLELGCFFLITILMDCSGEVVEWLESCEP